MSKVQRRRSVSVRPDVYLKLKAFCEARELAMSALLTDIITDGLALAYDKEARAERERLAAIDETPDQLILFDDHPPGACNCGRCPRCN